MLIALLILNAVLLSAAIALLVHNHKELRTQSRVLHPVLDLAPPAPDEVRSLLGQPRKRLISVEILNPMQLAAKHHAFAGILGNLAPGLIRREVHRQAASILRKELEKWDVMAEVRIHAAD